MHCYLNKTCDRLGNYIMKIPLGKLYGTQNALSSIYDRGDMSIGKVPPLSPRKKVGPNSFIYNSLACRLLE